jgi:hypothetical protein
MDMQESRREQVSALVDGEMDRCVSNASFLALGDPDARSAWLIYHQISDALCAQEVSRPLGDRFLRNFQERFALEKAHSNEAGTMPAASEASQSCVSNGRPRAFGRRLGIAGIAAASAAAVGAFFSVPALMVSESRIGDEKIAPKAGAPARAPGAERVLIDTGEPPRRSVPAKSPATKPVTNGEEAAVLRDFRVHAYHPLAHQRFSPLLDRSSYLGHTATPASV